MLLPPPQPRYFLYLDMIGVRRPRNLYQERKEKKEKQRKTKKICKSNWIEDTCDLMAKAAVNTDTGVHQPGQPRSTNLFHVSLRK
jgi:hypothetical protein